MQAKHAQHERKTKQDQINIQFIVHCIRNRQEHHPKIVYSVLCELTISVTTQSLHYYKIEYKKICQNKIFNKDVGFQLLQNYIYIKYLTYFFYINEAIVDAFHLFNFNIFYSQWKLLVNFGTNYACERPMQVNIVSCSVFYIQEYLFSNK